MKKNLLSWYRRANLGKNGRLIVWFTDLNCREEFSASCVLFQYLRTGSDQVQCCLKGVNDAVCLRGIE